MRHRGRAEKVIGTGVGQRKSDIESAGGGRTAETGWRPGGRMTPGGWGRWGSHIQRP